jgi:photosystem II stability/assembly factor-like uncharacterized protein
MKKLLLLIIVSLSSTYVNAQWSMCNSTINITDLATIGTNVFAGVNGGGVLMSTDNGVTWNSMNNGLTNTSVKTLAASGSNLFAGTYGGGVFLSTNNAVSWTKINNGLTDSTISAIVANGSNVFVGTTHGNVFYSSNNGGLWTYAGTGLPTTGSYLTINVLAINGSSIYAGTDGNGVYLSTNNGASWTAINTNILYAKVIDFLFSGSDIFITSSNGGVYKSTNNGSSWTLMNNGLTGYGTMSMNIIKYSTTLIISSVAGVWVSKDNAANWVQHNEGFTYNNSASFTILAPYIYVDNNLGIYKRLLTNLVSVEDNTFEKISISPNPAVNSIFIDGFSDFPLVQIYTLDGKLMLEEQLITNQLDISALANGLYFIKLSTAEGSVVRKFVKE